MSDRERAHAWLRRAQEDLRMVDLAIQDGLYAQACFHAQQAVEKALKAILVAQGRVPPRIHGLGRLLDLVNHPQLATMRYDIQRLSPYYGLARYPDLDIAEEEPSWTLARDQRAKETAETVLGRAQQLIEIGA